jgi:hypothetical protein
MKLVHYHEAMIQSPAMHRLLRQNSWGSFDPVSASETALGQLASPQFTLGQISDGVQEALMVEAVAG